MRAPTLVFVGGVSCAVVAVVGGGCAGEAEPALFAGTPAVVDDTVLVFPSGARFVSGLYSLSYLGQLAAPGDPPILVLAGVECGACDAPPSVLLRSPREGRVRAFNETLGWFPYPGRIRDYPDTTVVVRTTRLFWGQCAEDAEPGVVEYGTEYAANQTVRESVRAVQIRGGALVEEDLGSAGIKRLLEATLALVSKGVCREVPPRDRYVDP